MRLNFTSVLASASIITGVWSAAAPKPTADIEQGSILDLSGSETPKLSAAAALDIVKKLQGQLEPFQKNLNKTAHSVHKSSPKKEREHAIASAKKDLQGMAQAIYGATADVSTQARKGKGGNGGGQTGSVKALANALRTTLVTVAGTVNILLASLGLTPLLAFLTPVTASLSGLVLTLIPVVDNLLPILNVILDGVVSGLAGLLAGLIL